MKNDRDKDKALIWKEKAVCRSELLKAKNKRIKELEQSPEGWKEKYMSLKRKEASKLNRAARHHYPLLLVQLSVQWHAYGQMGLRACRHCLSCLYLCMELEYSLPSHVSIRNWACKCGYYQIQASLAKEQGRCQWVIWVDESIVLGGQSILLVLGLPLSQWRFERPVSVRDAYVLAVEAKHGWDHEQVAQVLARLQGQVSIAYVVSDQGGVLCKAYKKLGLTHVADCSHVLANGLEKLYKKDETFTSFIGWAASLRARWAMSREKVPFMPPAHRTKARFANIFPLVEWAIAVLARDTLQEASLPQAVKTELAWLEAQRCFIEDLEWIRQLTAKVCDVLKIQGFNESLAEKIEKMAHMDHYPSPKRQAFAQHLKDYLGHLKSLGLTFQAIVCCSDVIESAFGKFKQKIHPRSPFGMTEFLFTIANFGPPLSRQQVGEALENTTLANLYGVRAKQQSVHQKRRAFLGKKGGKTPSIL